MTRIGDTQPHRGIEFGVHDEGNDVWAWAYYPKIGQGVATRGQVNHHRPEICSSRSPTEFLE
jgi:hypothetical protein